MKRRIDWRKSWYRLPFIPFRVIILGVAYFVLPLLVKLLEIIGEAIPGIVDRYD